MYVFNSCQLIYSEWDAAVPRIIALNGRSYFSVALGTGLWYGWYHTADLLWAESSSLWPKQWQYQGNNSLQRAGSASAGLGKHCSTILLQILHLLVLLALNAVLSLGTSHPSLWTVYFSFLQMKGRKANCTNAALFMAYWTISFSSGSDLPAFLCFPLYAMWVLETCWLQNLCGIDRRAQDLAQRDDVPRPWSLFEPEWVWTALTSQKRWIIGVCKQN